MKTAAVYKSKWRTDQHSRRHRSAISSHPLPEETDFGPTVCS